MKKINWNLIYDELNLTCASTEIIAKKYGVKLVTLRYRARINGINLCERNRQIRELKLLRNYPKTLDLLDNTEIPIKEIAERNHVTHPIFIEFLKKQGYDLKSRNFRMRSAAAIRGKTNASKPERKINEELIKEQHKECLSGDGISLLAQRLPLNQLHKAFRCVC